MQVSFLPWGQYMEKELTAFAAGTMADVFEPALEEAVDLALKKRAIPLDPFLANSSVIKMDEYFPGGYEVYKVKGQLYCVPHRIDVRGNPYRISILAENGITETPVTWEDMAAAAQKLVKWEGDKLVRAGTSPWWTRPAHQYMHTLWQAGGELFTPDGTKAGFNTPEGVQALQYMIDLFHITYPKGQGQLETSPIPHFVTGREPLQYGTGAWARSWVIENKSELLSDVNSGVALKGLKAQVALIFGGGLSISTQAKDPATAWQVIEFIGRDENLSAWVDSISGVPPRQSGLEWEWVKKDPGVMQGFIEIAAKWGRSSPVFPEWGRLFDLQSDELNKAYYGEQSAEEALANTEKAWNEVLAEYAEEIAASQG